MSALPPESELLADIREQLRRIVSGIQDPTERRRALESMREVLLVRGDVAGLTPADVQALFDGLLRTH